MDKQLTPDEILKVKNFFQKFADSGSNLLLNNLDKDVYKTIESTVQDIDLVDSIVEYKQNNIFYSIDYAKSDSQGNLSLFIPEELVAELSDVIMGGNGENCYDGKLTELQVNSINNLLKKMMKEFEAIFKELFNKNLAFSTDNVIVTKDSEGYEDEINKNPLNFVVKEQIKLNSTKIYPVYLFLNYQEVKDLLISLNILDIKKQKVITGETINLDQLEDVKIKITAELGHKQVPIKYALELVKGSVVELDTIVNQDIKVLANGEEVAYAQIVAVEDNFGLRITKILTPEERMKTI